MFVFYFGIMADLTPPVALAAFAAAPFAGVPGMKIGVAAVRIALPGFIVPFIAVYDPALMLQQGEIGDVIYMCFKSLVAVGLWGAASVGFLRGALNWPGARGCCRSGIPSGRGSSADRRARVRCQRGLHPLARDPGPWSEARGALPVTGA